MYPLQASKMNYYIKHIIVGLIGIILVSNCYSQDTIHVDKRTNYFTSTDSINILSYLAKNIYSRANYSKELVKYSSDSAKMDFCFYYDNVRYIHPNKTYTFWIYKDSLLTSTNGYTEKWKFQKINDSLYRLEKTYSRLVESGFAKSLIPLEKTNEFCTQNQDGDTLWITNYSNIVFPEINIPEVQIEDSVYSICEIMPEYEKGDVGLRKDIAKNLFIEYPVIESDIYCSRYFVTFIIDKNGRMKNIKFKRTCGNGFVERAILVTLANLEDFSSGLMNEKPVNVSFTIPIHITFQ
jgi:hypothetical protein